MYKRHFVFVRDIGIKKLLIETAYMNLKTIKKIIGNKNGFTLIEMLTVLIVIGILMSIVVPIIGEANRKAKLTQVRSTIAKLELALSSYQTDHSLFPTPDSSGELNDSSGSLYQYLYKTKSTNGTEYMLIKNSEINANNQLIDPWKTEYSVSVLYEPLSCVPTNNTDSFDIYSKGANKVGDGSDSDDINNWTATN